MPAAPGTSAERIRDVNTAYHDVAAASYDSKWGIDFGATGQAQVRAKLRKALGALPDEPFAEALEIGAGTGYFSLNLLQLGLIERATATDISPGMLASLEANASRLGLEVSTEVSDAERLPFDDRQLRPRLRPRGPPSHPRPRARLLRAPPGAAAGRRDRLLRRALAPRRPPGGASQAGRRCPGPRLARGARRQPGAAGRSRRRERPRAGERGRRARLLPRAAAHRRCERAGFESRHVRGEELLANVWGWGLRSVEASADPDSVPIAWRRFAFRSYLALQRRRRRRCWSRACPRSSSTTSSSPPASRPNPAELHVPCPLGP